MQHEVEIVGAGRLGAALARAFAAAGWSVRCWSPTSRGRSIPGVELVEGRLPDVHAGELILLTVPDRSIAAVASSLSHGPGFRPGQVVAHVSGATGLEPLREAASQGAEVGSLHPLFAAAPGSADLSGTWAAVDGTPEARACLVAAARAIGLRPFHLPPEQRARYHAAASLAANGLVSLASLAAGLLEPAGLRREEALAALLPLLSSALDGLQRGGLPRALTGPVGRGDAEVVRRHLEALAGTEADAAYRALSLRAVELAREMGEAPEEALQDIATMLQGVE